ncbi:MAG: hypothetical protein ACI9VR_003939 [Cognaticolwellia sp.]
MLWVWLACTTLVVFPAEEPLPEDTGTPNPLDSWADTGGPQTQPLRLSPTLSPGLDADVPDIWVGCTTLIEVWVENASAQTLTVTGLLSEPTSPEFSLDPDFVNNGTLPWRLIPGDYRAFWVAYTPVDDQWDLIRVDVQTQGAGADSMRLELNARGKIFKSSSEPFKASLQSDPTRYTLAHTPVPGSIQVAVEEVDLGQAFTLEAPQTIVLAEEPNGNQVQIAYARPPADCP